MILDQASEFTIITVYDSPGGDKGDDWTQIKVKQNVNKVQVIIPSYEYSFEDDYITMEHHHHNGLDGKVSRFEVISFKSAEEMENFAANM